MGETPAAWTVSVNRDVFKLPDNLSIHREFQPISLFYFTRDVTQIEIIRFQLPFLRLPDGSMLRNSNWARYGQLSAAAAGETNYL